MLLPGPPREMKAMFARDVLPLIQKETSGAVILSRTLHTFCVGESAVAELQLGEQVRFYPTDAALASWMAQSDGGQAQIVYE